MFSIRTFLGVLLLVLPWSAMADDLAETVEVRFLTTEAIPLKAKADELGSAVAIYEYVRNTLEFAVYFGARSDSVNTFLGMRGNDVDAASTLIAMLRARSIPARYVVGRVRLSASDAKSWIGVDDLDLAVRLLNDMGIQGVTLAADRSYAELEHVWVEALVLFDEYRGTGASATFNCGANRSRCRWVALDPSFKRRSYRAGLLDVYGEVSFDYMGYFNAIKDDDPALRDKNPLEIYEENILAYLRASYPAKTLEDVARHAWIVAEAPGVLPASLPYTVIGTLRRYDSVDAHDAAVPATEAKKWARYLNIKFDIAGALFSAPAVRISELGTKRLSFSYVPGTTPRQALSLGGTTIAFLNLNGSQLDGEGNPIVAGTRYALILDLDAEPATTPGGTDAIINATYPGLELGGYVLIGTGGETSNRAQIKRATDKLLAATKQYPVVYSGNVPYVDVNASGGYDAGDTPLLQTQAAMDALTGGLLETALYSYYSQEREMYQRFDELDHTITPIRGFVGIVSSLYNVEYDFDGTPFSIVPGGLLIDMAGIALLGIWRVDAVDDYSSSTFKLMGHAGSSLEHEIWQQLTGYDAISTMRGIQFALADGRTLLNPKRNATANTLPSLYDDLGYFTAASSPFVKRESTVFSSQPVTWYLSPDDAQLHAFHTLLAQPSLSTPDLRRLGLNYWSDNDQDGFITAVDSMENTLQGGIAQYGANCTLSPPGYYFGGSDHFGNCQTVLDELQSFYVAFTNTDLDRYLDKAQGFVPTAQVYRDLALASDYHAPSTVHYLRDNLYLHNIAQEWFDYQIPSRQVALPNDQYFGVYVESAYLTALSDRLVLQTFAIANNTLVGGGGYVDSSLLLEQYLPQATTTARTPAYNNEFFTDQQLVGVTNNDTVKTPSTIDPVSTVTGNMYHDEIDFVIKGRGLDYVFTRTYNSAPAQSNLLGPTGYGWTHSYAMRLKSNDFGNCPNCPAGSGAGQSPENGNGKTASISYLDERAGEHNYLVDETTFAVTRPTGEYDTLALDTPAAGQYTLTFRNGVKYVFEDPSYSAASDLKKVPGKVARLVQIADPFGNQLNMSYDTSGRLSQVVDNLGIAGRTGLAFTYWSTSTRLKSVSDWSGRQWQYAYHTGDTLATVTDALGYVTQYTYHTGTRRLKDIVRPQLRNGQIVRMTYDYYRNHKAYNYSNSLGDTESLAYDLFRGKTAVTDPRGYAREYTYDPATGALAKLEEPDGAVLLFENTAEGLRSRKTDGRGYSTTYSYRTDRAFTGAPDAGGQVTRERDALNYDVDYTYGPLDQIATVKDKRGTITTTGFYTTAGACAVVNKPKEVRLSRLGTATNVLLAEFCWNADGTLASRTEYIEPGNTTRRRVTSYTYEAGSNGLNVAEINVTGAGQTVRTAFTYDSLGRVKTETLYRRTSPTNAALLALTTAYDYDKRDRVIKLTTPRGDITETVFDANGLVSSVRGQYKRPGGGFDVRTILTRTYDAADRLIEERDVFGHATTYGYDAAGNVVRVTDPEKHTTRYEYDALGRRTSVIAATGQRSETRYDLAGNAVAVENANDETVTSGYDALNRLVKVTDARGFVSTLAYDANSNLACTVDANAQAALQPKNAQGCTVYREYDELNRLVRETDALNGVTQYAWDLLGHRTAITDAEGRTTAFLYDDLGRLTQIRDPLIEIPTDKVTTLLTDEAGNVYQKTDRKGQVTQYTYDVVNRLTDVLYADASTETHTFDHFGDRTQVSNAATGYHFGYDAKHRLSNKLDTRNNRALAWFYDWADNVLLKQGYTGDQTLYQYDAANRLANLQNSRFVSVDYHHDPVGRVLDRVLSNGATTQYRYDANGFLLNLKHATASGAVLADASYTRDRRGNTLTETAGGNVTTYVYDALYRLRSADYPGTANDESWTYDKVGNRQTHTRGATTHHYIVDAGNRLLETRQGSTSGPLLTAYVYDANGNVTKKCAGGTVTRSATSCTGGTVIILAWDAQDRLASVSGSVPATNGYSYDPFDYRIGTSDSRGPLSQYLEGEHLDATYSGTTLKAKYLRGARIDELVNGFVYDAANAATNLTFHHDRVTSITGLSSHNGDNLQTLHYNAFGRVLANNLNGLFPTNHLKYTGREEDPDTGLYYYRARYYDPDTGRFLSEDPLGFAAGVNFYAYVNNNPVNFNDPFGEDTQVSLGYTKVIGPTNHQFVILTDTETGQQFATRAGPSAQGFSGSASNSGLSASGGSLSASSGNGGSGGFGFGQIEAIARDFNEGFGRDFKNVQATQNLGVIELDFADAKASAIEFSNVTNQNRIPYWPLGPNSNSYASTFIEALTGTRPEANLLSPGAGLGTPSPALSFDPTPFINSSGGAGGGFVLYPNKPNTNMLQQVYSK